MKNSQFGKILAPEIRGSTQSFIGNILKGDGAALGSLPSRKYKVKMSSGKY